jgi:hypothetical protein
MPIRPFSPITAALFLSVAPLQAHAQRTPLPLLDRVEEEALARSAATPGISDHADVWVLADEGFRLQVRGSNGWTCLVERDHPESLAPICFVPVAAWSDGGP